MELEKSSPKSDRRAPVDAMESSNGRRLVKTLTRVFKTKVVSRQQAEELERRYSEEVRLRKEAEEALVREKEVFERRYNEEVRLRKQAEEALREKDEFEKRYSEEVRLRKEADEALVREKEELERRYSEEFRLTKEAEEELKVTKLLLESYKEDQDKLKLQAKALGQKHGNELRLRKDTEVVLAIELERIDKLKTRLATLENEHNDVIVKAQELESNYIHELILKKAFMKEHRDLVEAYNRDVDIDAYTMREERDNALMLVEEITRQQMEDSRPPLSFICPISQEVMKDPQFTADGYTYEAEAIRKWLDTGHDTSPMTNLKLSHRYLVPNRALQSAIQELVCPSLLSSLD